MRILISIIASFLLSAASADEAEIPLWPNGAPAAVGTAPKDTPTLTPYLPDPATVVMMPVVEILRTR